MKSYFSRIRTNLNQRAKSRRRSGFTLAELLIVVAMMIILFGFAFAGIINFVRNLNQTELDKTAEVIYVAAQNRMSEIYASGESYKLTAAASGQGGMAGVAVVQNAPSDWDESVSGSYPDDSDKKLCMIASTSTDAAEYLFPENTIIAEEWRLGNWIVEYDPSTLMVYSVFFSKKIDPYVYYNAQGRLRPVDAVESRRNYGATVGYYGGPVAALDHEQVTTIYCQVKAEEFNKEKLLAQIVVGNVPVILAGEVDSSKIDLKIKITGESSGNTIELSRTLGSADIDDSDPTDRNKRTCYLLLDGLADGEHFKDQYVDNLNEIKKSADGKGHFTVKEATGALIPGENITIEVQARCRNPYVNSPAPSSDTTNSLFASVDAEGGNVIAEVAYGRHLQNLDSTISGFDSTNIHKIAKNDDAKVNVLQIPNQEGVDAIDFSKNAPDNASPSVTDVSPITDKIKYYYATYGEREFESVTNDNIESYDGQKNRIIGANIVPNDNATGNEKNAGLFGAFSGSSLTDMHIVNERVKGAEGNSGATGAIVGVSEKELSIKGCMVYLNEEIDYNWTDTTYASTDDWIKEGKYVGGLIGESKNNVDIESSMSSTVLKSSISNASTPTNFVGGLIGKSDSSVSIRQSYTDSYLSGEQIAGLVANAGAGVGIEASYVSGFAIQQGSSESSVGSFFKKGAAFVAGNGESTIKKSYSVFDFTDPTPDIEKPAGTEFEIFAISEKVKTVADVFYSSGSYSDSYDNNVLAVSRDELKNAATSTGALDPKSTIIRDSLGDVFLMTDGAENRNNTYPYNLTKSFMLDTYPYPLLDMRHYGDWSVVNIEPGTLVYFERYVSDDGTGLPEYRFSGAGRSYLYSYEELKNLNGKSYHVDLDGYAVLFPMDEIDDPSKAYENDVDIKYDDDALAGLVTLTLPAESDDNIETVIRISGRNTKFQLRPIDYLVDLQSTGEYSGINLLNPNRYNQYYIPIIVENNSGRTKQYIFQPTLASTVVEVPEINDKEIGREGPDVISVRTPRQLENMGTFYNHYCDKTVKSTFKQDLDIDFEKYSWADIGDKLKVWDLMAGRKIDISAIGSDYYHNYSFDTVTGIADPQNSHEREFLATYDGGCKLITNVGLKAQNNYQTADIYVTTMGLFEVISTNATVKNVVYVNNYSETNALPMYGIYNGDISTSNDGKINVNINSGEFYNGVLAGINKGTISNCAVTGQVFEGNIRGQSSLFVGGLVGYNSGVIQNSSADVPRIRVNIQSSTADLGAFAGCNTGTITQCFANGRIVVEEYDGKMGQYFSGFVGDNVNGRISNSYCATSKQVPESGEKHCYGFTSTNGSSSGCVYINDDAYYYVNGLYAYSDFNSKPASAISDSKLKELSIPGFGKAVYSSYNTFTLSRDAGATVYPYPTSVVNSYGQNVYYGEWPLLEGFGDFGFFYWEKEVGGTNSGYHYYLMTNKSVGNTDNKVPQIRTNLCVSHDDGGTITEYGYGYYAEKSKDSLISKEKNTLTWRNINPGIKNDEASKSIAGLFSDGNYNFHAYTTLPAFGDNVDNNYMYLNTTDANPTATGEDALTVGWGSITIGKQGGTEEDIKPVTYYFSPYFAASMVREDESKDKNTSPESLVGSVDHRFQVRNTDQLQYINWNNSSKNTKVTLNKSLFGSINDHEASDYNTNEKAKAFPYLGYAYANGNDISVHHNANLYWLQSHDVDFNMAANSDGKKYVPIGSIYDSNYNSQVDNSFVYTNYFNGDYDGDSFVIKNLQIKSDAMSVGLFGITVGAHLDHVILYSDRNNVIGNTSSDEAIGWYNLGGLSGMSLTGGDKIKKILTLYDDREEYREQGNANDQFVKPFVMVESCVCSGYQINDVRKNHGIGGANVGGLIGASNVLIRKSLSVNDITINPQYNDNTSHIRVGGIVGTFRGNTMKGCYSGGSIKRIIVNDESEGKIVNKDNIVGYGGVIGGWQFRASGSLNGLIGALESTPSIKKVYTYADPRGYKPSVANGGIRPIINSCDEPWSFTTSYCYYLNIYGTDVYTKGAAITGISEIDYDYLSATKTYSAIEDIYNGINDHVSASKLPDKAEYRPFYRVTCYQHPAGDKKYNEGKGKPVDGVFSFHGSDSSLQGKNFPFPTVIDQIDSYGETVHVHYGAWPKSEGLFTSAIETNLDLLSSRDKSANINVSLYNEGAGQVDLDESMITISSSSSSHTPEFVDVEKTTELVGGIKEVKLSLTAKKTGSENLTISYKKDEKTTYSVDISVTVTAVVAVKAVPVNLTPDGEYGYDPEKGADLSFGSYVYHKKIKYNLTAKNIDEDELNPGSTLDEEGKDGIWQLETGDDKDYDHSICEVTLDSAGKSITIETLSVGKTKVNLRFISKVKTGIDDENVKSDILSISVEVKSKPEWNITPPEPLDNDSGDPPTDPPAMMSLDEEYYGDNKDPVLGDEKVNDLPGEDNPLDKKEKDVLPDGGEDDSSGEDVEVVNESDTANNN